MKETASQKLATLWAYIKGWFSGLGKIDEKQK